MHEHEHEHENGHLHEHNHEHGCDCGHLHEHNHEHEHGFEGDLENEASNMPKTHSPFCRCATCREACAAGRIRIQSDETLKIVGLDCPSCAAGVQRAVQALEEVEAAELIYASGTLHVRYCVGVDAPAGKARIIAAVRSTGHDVEQLDSDGLVSKSAIQRRNAVAMAVCGIFGVAGVVVHFLGVSEIAQALLSLVSIAAGLVIMLPRAITSLKLRSIDMNVLMLVAVIGAVALGEYPEAAMVIFLFALGGVLEAHSMNKSRESIRSLMDLAPDVAHVLSEGVEEDVDPSEVAIGDTVVVLPGERIPLDGTVSAGFGFVDEAPVTGESIPVLKEKGMSVYSGTMCVNSRLEFKVTSPASSSTLVRIVELVEQAQATKAPHEAFVDKFARIYTPIVVGAALALAVVPPLLTQLTPLEIGGWEKWIYTALVLLVISCPCALVISTPVSIVSAITRAARDGVLVKGGAFLELAAQVRAIAFDKTGTLTNGTPCVSQFFARDDDLTKEAVLTLAASIEASSTHPLAHAVCAAAKDRGLETASATDVFETAGKGAVGSIDGERIFVGSKTWAEETGALDETTEEMVDEIEQDGATALVVFTSSKTLGILAVSDTIRPQAAQFVQRLMSSAGLKRSVMLTGDNAFSAASVASSCGVDEYRARLLPSDKTKAVAELQARYGKVAYVGDGINDAPALALSDVGIAMGAAGSDTALETADVALLADDLDALPGFFALGKRTMRIIRQNVVLALGVKFIVFVLAILGFANMWMAVFADTGIALIVIVNGMRLLRNRPRRRENL